LYGIGASPLYLCAKNSVRGRGRHPPGSLPSWMGRHAKRNETKLEAEDDNDGKEKEIENTE